MSTVVINIFLPCLLFSKTVPSFTPENVGDVGVLVLTAVVYQCTLLDIMFLIIVLGLLSALVVRWVSPMPYWRNGLLFAGIFSNWGTKQFK